MRIQILALGLFILVLTMLVGTPDFIRSSVTEATPLHTASDLNASVRHIRATHTYTEPSGQVVSQQGIEFWLDTSNGNARYEEKDASGQVELVEIQSGLVYSTYLPKQGIAETMIASDGNAGFLQNVEQAVLDNQDRMQLPPDQSGILTNDIVDGQTATVFSGGRWEGGTEIVDEVRAWVSTESGLTLKEVAYDRDQAGSLQEVERKTIAYHMDQQVSRSQLPANLFDTSVPAAQYPYRGTQRYQAATSATSFQEFQTYWLGPTYGAVPLFAITHDEEMDGTTRLSSVDVTYAHPFIDGMQSSVEQISITQESIVTAGERPQGGDPGGGQLSESVTVNGRQALLYDNGHGDVQVELNMEGTLVAVSASTRDQALRAAAHLRKLNDCPPPSP